jgi:hypothetical protein
MFYLSQFLDDISNIRWVINKRFLKCFLQIIHNIFMILLSSLKNRISPRHQTTLIRQHPSKNINRFNQISRLQLSYCLQYTSLPLLKCLFILNFTIFLIKFCIYLVQFFCYLLNQFLLAPIHLLSHLFKKLFNFIYFLFFNTKVVLT